MIDHTVVVSDFERSKAFYRAALAPPDMDLLMELSAAVSGTHDMAGYGVPPRPEFWIHSGTPNVPPARCLPRRRSRPGSMPSAGPRPHHRRNYYGAFVLDPDGHNIEAVCHERPQD